MADASQTPPKMTPFSSPMNLTCGPKGAVSPAKAAAPNAPAAEPQYLLVFSIDGHPGAPDPSWKPLPGFHSPSSIYVMKTPDDDGDTVEFEIPPHGIAIYTK